MFKLTSTKQGGSRLMATEKLTAGDFTAIGKACGTPPVKARKLGLVAARRSSSEAKIETHWNGKETENTAAVGDWVVTNLAPDAQTLRDNDGNANTYVIRAERFAELYEPNNVSNDFGDIYRSISQVDAIYLSGGLDIVAPWDERQSSAAGYLLLNGCEVYGNHEETFRATYELLE